ncbi:MFS general substrate transporter [Phanerochaete sordida]|uniref:MFS general substrate transporter n=1 Tax=Phanerochaete sordida TaxID=48140 RepID=A0A9P3L888_9APHY|nr:MFS general substrate transporter [Phanerochaete sordida]
MKLDDELPAHHRGRQITCNDTSSPRLPLALAHPEAFKMPVHAVLRDSFIGTLVYFLSGRRYFRHPEELPGFVLPEKYATAGADRSARGGDQCEASSQTRSVAAAAADPSTSGEDSNIPQTEPASEPRNEQDADNVSETTTMRPVSDNGDLEKGANGKKQKEQVTEQPSDSEVVDWYGPDDPECPRNWSFVKRCFVTFDICLLTFSIYIGSAIYSPGIGLVAQQFGISDVAATLGLALFVAGYGIGPMFLSPLSEIPQFGRTTVYMLAMLVFVCIQVPTALSKNLGALLPLRFLAGFVGSPPLATGGASVADMWAPEDRAVVIGVWGLAAVCGPVLGPLLGGFAAQAENWPWTIWILLWLSGGSFAWLAFTLPETSAQAILYRRAGRLRRLTGNPNLRSQGEIDAAQMSLGEVAQMTLVRPFVLTLREPIVFFINLYVALAYGILYVFIASFNVVFMEMHGFNLGQNGLAFLGLFVGAVITYACFAPYAIYVLKPMFKDGEENFIPENRLPVAMVGAIFLPISLFWFGWTSSSSINFIVPIIGSAFFSAGVFLLFQAALNYLSDCYPRYVASILAGNDLFRSSLGAGFPLFSTAFFHNLGVGPACSILGGIAVAMIPIPFVLYVYGARIRAWSKYAN